MDFFNILVVIALIAFSVFKQTPKKGTSTRQPQSRRPRKVIYPVDEEEESDDEMPFPKRPKLRMKSFVPSPEPLGERVEQPKNPRPAAASIRQEVKKREEQPERELSLRNPSEARRAFIYSEIWNRKYD